MDSKKGYKVATLTATASLMAPARLQGQTGLKEELAGLAQEQYMEYKRQ